MSVYVKQNGSWIEVAGGGSGVVDTNTTYSLTGGASGSDAYIRLAGSDSTNNDFTFVAGSNIQFSNQGASGFEIAATIGASDIGVSQSSYTCTNPITVSDVNGVATINIGDTSNAHGKRYVQATEPTGVCDGDIWYDFSDGSGQAVTVDAENKVARIWDQKPFTTDGGTFNSGGWLDRDLNTKDDPNNIVTLGTNSFSLLPGTYRIKWSAPAFRVDRHQTRLLYSGASDFSSNSVEYGSSEYNSELYYQQTRSFGEAILTFTSTTYFKIQHRCQTTTTNNVNGLGVNSGFANNFEIYTQVSIEDLSTTALTGTSTTGTALQYAVEQTASGTNVDFVGVPEWAKRITVLFDNVSRPSGTPSPEYLIQLGTANGYITSNYSSSSSRHDLNGNFSVTSTSGFIIEGGTLSGDYSLYKHNNTTYVGSGGHSASRTSAGRLSSVSGTINSIRITTTTGASFSGGTIQVIYEGESSGGSESAPAGTIIAWGGSVASIPTGYILCDGSTLSRSSYAELFNAIGTTNGAGDGSSTFLIPNLVDRFVVGAESDGAGTVYPGLSPGATGGSANAVLIAHNHRITANSSGSIQNDYFGGSTNSYGINASGSGNVNYDSTIKTKGITTSGADSTSQTGTNANLPPYYALCYIIKTGTTSGTAIPAGTVSWFASSTAPTGYVKANGAELLKTAYSDLYAEIGTTYGETDGNGGTGTSHFRVPDLRGEFIRGWDDGRGADLNQTYSAPNTGANGENIAVTSSTRTLGSSQSWSIQNITGKVTNLNYPASGSGVFSSYNGGGSEKTDDGGNNAYAFTFNTARQVKSSDETRPRNLALLACIKY